MIKILLIVPILVLALAVSTIAQPLKPGEWRTYTAMTNISDIAVTTDSQIVWVATQGGVYRVPLQQISGATVQSLRNSEGLSANEVTAIALGYDNTLYVGNSTGGLDIYHPSTGKVENVADISLSTQFTRKQINKILASDSELYIATGFGLSIYNTRRGFFAETVTRFGSHIDQDTVFDCALFSDTIFSVLNSALAFAPRNAPALSAPFSWKTINAAKNIDLHAVAAFKSKIVVGSLQGLFLRVGDSLRSIPLSDSISVVKMLVKDDSLYILDSRGGNRIIVTADLINFRYEQLRKTSSQATVSSFAITKDHSRISGFTAGGITVESSLTPINGFAPDGPLTNDINDLHFAQQRATLFTVYGSEGMTAFDPSNSTWTPYRGRGIQLPDAGYTKVYYDTVRSLLWLSSFGGGVFSVKLSPFTVTHYGVSEGISSVDGGEFIVSGAGQLDNKGNFIVSVWAFDGKGIARTSDAKTFTGLQLNPPDNLYRPFGVIAQDLDNYYYAGTINKEQPSPYGVIAYLPDGSTYPLAGGTGRFLAHQGVDAMLVDQDNGLWCGTSVGVEIVSHTHDFNTGLLQFRTRKLPFLDQQIVHAMTVDGIGNKWVGTEDGVFVVSADGTDSLAHFTKANSPLINNYVNTIAIDYSTGEAYFGTPKGISRTSSIFKQGSADYKKISLFPNPLIQQGSSEVSVTINGLVQGSTLKVFTPAGRLVSTIDATQLGGNVRWNARDENGQLLPSGVYVVSADAPTAVESGQTKFVLVRK